MTEQAPFFGLPEDEVAPNAIMLVETYGDEVTA